MNEQQDFEIKATAFMEEESRFSPAGNAIGVFAILLVISSILCCMLSAT